MAYPDSPTFDAPCDGGDFLDALLGRQRGLQIPELLRVAALVLWREEEEEEAGVSIRFVEPRVGVGPVAFALWKGRQLAAYESHKLIRGTLSIAD